MGKETHDIRIKLVLPRYEVMNIIYALNELANRRQEQFTERRQDFLRVEASDLRTLANQISITLKPQNEHKPTTTQRNIPV